MVRKLRAAAAIDGPADVLLTAAGQDVAQALLKGGLLSRSQADEVSASASALIADIREHEAKLGLPRTTVRHLGLFAKGSGSLRLSTMHAAKGREWAGVAVIDAHDGKVPHFSYAQWGRPEDEREAIFEEGRRVLYVALTRATKVLMMFTAEPNSRTRPSPFLTKMFPGGARRA